jgi:hypothetical protein
MYTMCLRPGCNHRFTQPRGYPYGERCRRRIVRACLVLEGSGNRTAAKAAELLRTGACVPMRCRPGGIQIWQCPSQDGTRTYLCTPEHCSCPSGQYRPQGLCCHRMACAVLAA